MSGPAIIKDPVAAVLSEAKRWIKTSEEPPGSNRGVAIDFFNYFSLPVWKPFPNGMKGAPWCAAFVSTVGRLALGEAWPVVRTPSCLAIGKWAESQGVLFQHSDGPQRGDLFLLYYERLKRYGHVGFVTSVTADSFETLEGNTSMTGGREGHGVFQRIRRRTEKTFFVRWVSKLEDAE